MFKEYPDVVTVHDLAKMLHVGLTTAYHLVCSGEIRSVWVGRQRRIPKIWVIQFLNSQKQD